MKTVYLELTKRARTKEVTGLLHISDRLLAGESSRVEWSRGTLDSSLDRKCIIYIGQQVSV